MPFHFSRHRDDKKEQKEGDSSNHASSLSSRLKPSKLFHQHKKDTSLQANLQHGQSLAPPSTAGSPSIENVPATSNEGVSPSVTTISNSITDVLEDVNIQSPPKPVPIKEENPLSLWDQAYEVLMLDDEKLIGKYEAIVQQEFLSVQNQGPLLGISQRQAQLDKVGSDGLKLNESKGMIYIAGHAISIRKQLQTVGTVINMTKTWVDSAVQASPQASVAWSVICLALPLLSKPVEAESASTSGFTYVSSRMTFYIAMEDLLLYARPSAESEKPQEELKNHILELYRNILKFQIHCIIRFHRSTAKTMFDDITGSVDWENLRRTVENQEKLVLAEAQAIRNSDSGITMQRSLDALNDLRSDAVDMNKSLDHLVSLARERNTLLQQMHDRALTQDESNCLQVFSRTPSYEKYKQEVPKRVEGTCVWFLSQPAYQRWLSQEEGILLISADPGCGKSVLARHIIDVELMKQSDTVVCYFFFKDQYQNLLAEALCALLHQLFSKEKNLLKHAVPHFNSRGKTLADNEEVLMNIMVDAISDPNRRPIIFVIDALDECEDVGREKLFGLLEDLQDKTKTIPCKFLLTSRPYNQILSNFRTLQCHHDVHVQADDNPEVTAHDVELFIKNRLERLCRARRLKEELRAEVEQALVAKQNRTYLWVRLVLEVLEKGSPKTTRIELETFLSTLPASVYAAYEQILSKSADDTDAKIMAYHTFCALLSSKEPLSLKQVQCVAKMRLSPRISAHNELDLEDDETFAEKLRNACGLLIQIHGDQVSFLHQTAREFLLPSTQMQSTQASITTWGGSIDKAQANNVMAQVCVNYICLSEFGQDLPVDLEIYPLLSYAANFWDVHFGQSVFNVEDEFLVYLRRLCDESLFDLWTGLRRRQRAGPKRADVVAVGCWIPSVLLLQSFASSLDRGQLAVACQASFLTAVRLGNIEITRWLLQNGASFPTAKNGQQTALEIAMNWGQSGMIQLLLEYKANPDERYRDGITPLHIAVKQNNVNSLKLLMEHGASPKLQSSSGLTAVELSIWLHNVDLTMILLEYLLNTKDFPLNDGDVFRLLRIALECDDLAAFKKIMAKRPPEKPRLHGDMTLHEVALQHPFYKTLGTENHGGQLFKFNMPFRRPFIGSRNDNRPLGKINQMDGPLRSAWLKSQTDVLYDLDGFTLLQRAVIAHRDFVPFLLQKDIFLDTQDTQEYTALHHAVVLEDLATVRTLLEKNADCNIGSHHIHNVQNKRPAYQDGTLSGIITPLTSAICFPHPLQADIVSLLAEHGADCNARIPQGLTMPDITGRSKCIFSDSHIASTKANAIIGEIRALRQEKTKEISNPTALIFAASKGNTEIVKLLLANGADPTLVDARGNTAQDVAAARGYSQIVDLLSTKVVQEGDFTG